MTHCSATERSSFCRGRVCFWESIIRRNSETFITCHEKKSALTLSLSIWVCLKRPIGKIQPFLWVPAWWKGELTNKTKQKVQITVTGSLVNILVCKPQWNAPVEKSLSPFTFLQWVRVLQHLSQVNYESCILNLWVNCLVYSSSVLFSLYTSSPDTWIWEWAAKWFPSWWVASMKTLRKLPVHRVPENR